MPWESEKGELPALELSDFGTPVHKLLAQPHRLELFTRGHRKPLVYFPDLLLVVDRSFVERLASKVPFGDALVEWVPSVGQTETRQLVVEVKDDGDRRLGDPDYEEKLAMAADVYRRVGMEFVTILRSKDIDCVPIAPVRDILMDRYARVGTSDVEDVRRCLHAGRGSAMAGDVTEALGGDAVGWGKLAALHVRRVLSIDLREGLHDDCRVSWVGDGHAIWHGGR